MTLRILSMVALCAVLFENCLATPAVVLWANKRVQRSPQFGFPERVPEYPEYPIGGGFPPSPGAFGPPVLPGALPGVLPGVLPGALPGALSPPGILPGAYPPIGAYPERQSAGAAFASANTDSLNVGGRPSEEQSHASSQSANFNFGPLSASFSNAEASSDSESF